jgi:hypothetical protein
MTVGEAEARRHVLEQRLATIREIVDTTAKNDLRSILADMLDDGEHALALLKEQLPSR